MESKLLWEIQVSNCQSLFLWFLPGFNGSVPFTGAWEKGVQQVQLSLKHLHAGKKLHLWSARIRCKDGVEASRRQVQSDS